jgi:predicted Zn-dependent peptidase
MQTKNFDPYDFSKKEIDGVSVYYKNLPWAPCINIRIVFNNGAFDDSIGKEGLSHFLEHLLLKGCPSIPNKKAIKEWSKINALNTLNAFTSFDNTWYTLKCLPDKYDVVISGLKDMIFNSFLRDEDIEEERKVITQEAWNNYLNDKYLKYLKEFVDIMYSGNQRSRIASALGWPDTINNITKNDIVSWHKKNYGIGNFYIVMTGAIEIEHVKKLEDFIKDLPHVSSCDEEFGIINKPKQNKIIKRADDVGEVKEQVEISVYRITRETPYKTNEITNIFSRLVYDLLNEKLRTELSLCYGVSSNVWRTKKFTQMSIGVKTDEKNIEIVENEIKYIFDNIINKKYIDRFNLIKNLYKEQIKSAEFFSGDIAQNALSEISRFNGHIVSQEEQLRDIEKTTYDDIVGLAKHIFDPEYMCTEIILPSKK